MSAELAGAVPGIIDALVTQAKAGDVQADRLILERAMPATSTRDRVALLSLPLAGTPQEQAQAVSEAAHKGKAAGNRRASADHHQHVGSGTSSCSANRAPLCLSRALQGCLVIARDARLYAIETTIVQLIEKHGPEDPQMILFDVGTKETIAAFTRIMAAEHAHLFRAAGLSPREASYRITNLTGMSVRNARRYADDVFNTIYKKIHVYDESSR